MGDKHKSIKYQIVERRKLAGQMFGKTGELISLARVIKNMMPVTATCSRPHIATDYRFCKKITIYTYKDRRKAFDPLMQ